MDTLKLFQRTTEVEAFPAGKMIFEVGDPGTVMYVVQEGEVDVTVGGQVVETAGPGGIVGEMALIDSSPRSAAAAARTDCKLVPIDERRFTHLVQQHPYFSLHVMRVMVHRLRRSDSRSARPIEP